MLLCSIIRNVGVLLLPLLALASAQSSDNNLQRSQDRSQNAQSYQFFNEESLLIPDHWPPQTPACGAALRTTIQCDGLTIPLQSSVLDWASLRPEQVQSICRPKCGDSLTQAFRNVEKECVADLIIQDMSPVSPVEAARSAWVAWNELCLTMCGRIITSPSWPRVNNFTELPIDDLCSLCTVDRFRLMRSSPFWYHDDDIKAELNYAYSECTERRAAAARDPSTIKNVSDEEEYFNSDESCVSGLAITVDQGDTCTSLALKHGVASAQILFHNRDKIDNCVDALHPKTQLCLPPQCELTYHLQPRDSCASIKYRNLEKLRPYLMGGRNVLRRFNKWIDLGCTNLHHESDTKYGHVLCLSPLNGDFAFSKDDPRLDVDLRTQPGYTGLDENGSFHYAEVALIDIRKKATIAPGTKLGCGIWHIAQKGETCRDIVYPRETTAEIFMKVNPSLGKSVKECSERLRHGLAYCAKPLQAWRSYDKEREKDEL